MKRYLLIILILTTAISSAFSTHNRAGEITYEQKSGFTYSFKLVTYTYTLSAANESRDSLPINWGDGSPVQYIKRKLQLELPNLILYNEYTAEHTFPGVGRYEVLMMDPNRNEGVKNINNSVEVVFAIKTTLQISSLLGTNNTPKLTNAPVDKAFKGKIFIHNPGAYDPDGDSISYKLTTCLGENGVSIPGYSLPPFTKELRVDPISGDLIWDSPPYIGVYNVAMIIEEWRSGLKIGEIIRDMQIEVYDTDEKPPLIDPIEDICVLAGDTVKFDVTARSQNNAYVYLNGNGGPLEVSSSPAIFESDTAMNIASTTFFWATNCTHIAKFAYQLVIKAESPSKKIESNPYLGNTEIKLVSYENVNILVVAPPPVNLASDATTRTVLLSWEAGACPGVEKYKIYRKIGTSEYEPDKCVTGLPDAAGYEKIGEVSELSFLDNNNGKGLWQGLIYCYRVVGVYPDGAESYPSEELCVQLKRGLVVITHVDVNKTDKQTGEIFLKWLTPKDFDTEAHPGPYRYLIFRSYDLYAAKLQQIATLDGIEHTQYTDKNINTNDTPVSYIIGFFNVENNGSLEEIGPSDVAASVFVDIEEQGQKLKLNLLNYTPWEVDSFKIFKKNPTTSVFEQIAATDTIFYYDTNLINGTQYCYYAVSYGHYLLDEIERPLINRSQIACGIPTDTIAPCPPPLTLESFCDDHTIKLTWKNPNYICADDVVSYNLYYKEFIQDEFSLLKTTTDLKDTTFLHLFTDLPKGCYTVTAVDATGNESEMSETCTDKCTEFNLPNIFTPNQDGQNDLYKPTTVFGVEKIELKIYNRWGNVVYETTDPNINWDGKLMNTNKIVSSGVYYYICDVYEKRLTGIEIRNLTGFIHVYSEDENGGEK